METTFSSIIIEPLLYSCDNIITNVNKDFLDLTEYALDELLNRSLIEIGEMLKINSQILLDTIDSNYTCYIFTKSSQSIEVNISLSHVKGTNESIYTFIETPNSRLNDKLMFVEQSFIDNISGVAIYSVPDLILLKANQKYLNFTDSSFNKGENSIGSPIREIIPGFSGSQVEVIYNTVLGSQKANYIKDFKFDSFTRGITYWDSTLTPIFENNKMKYLFQTATQVTQNVIKNQIVKRRTNLIENRTELASVRCRFEMLSRVIDTFDLPVIRLSCPDLNIIDINKKAFDNIKLLNPDFKSINLIRNNNAEILLGPLKTTEYYKCISEVLKEKKTKYLNKKKHLINGDEVYWNLIFEPVFKLNGEIEEILVLIIDVTPEIKSNIVMERALKLQGEFLVNVSHELKTPLNVIFATTQLLNMYCTNGSLDQKKDSIIKYIASIKQNSYKLSKMINNIVDLSKIEAGFFKLNLSNNNIVEFVEEIAMSVTNFTDSKGLKIIFDTDTEEKIIACDPEKVERVVLNLISNAIKFSDEGDDIFINVNDKNEFVEISVKDTGVGIEDKYLDMIFDRFNQVDNSLSRNAEGTGIGLSLVKSIVELHGGSISVESEFGSGSTFTVKLPSKKVLNEDTLYNSKMRSRNETVQVELSDAYS
ncbi:HAMP domain-containing histidine kinase [Clostridium estertheticum]|uniref:PAS domain-containing sensor histidine kinase n=1 Tax=Clostridium estertheticum TaxID=238834 RepID=UPI001CCCEF21|nr:HAMP domain-containing sensor histidine kinase [Clostridium estertheticum]MBZ9609288.1 HAMP domain-containing histidine kinase [Clostridium estertheticum]